MPINSTLSNGSNNKPQTNLTTKQTAKGKSNKFEPKKKVDFDTSRFEYFNKYL